MGPLSGKKKKNDLKDNFFMSRKLKFVVKQQSKTVFMRSLNELRLSSRTVYNTNTNMSVTLEPFLLFF